MRKLLFSLLALATLCGGVCAQFSVLPGFPPGVFQDRGALEGGGVAPSPPSIDGSATNSFGGSAPLTVSLTTTKTNDLIVVFCTINSTSTTVATTDTGGANLTWTNRVLSQNSGFYYVYEAWAFATGILTADPIVITPSSSSFTECVVWGVNGTSGAGAPFDTNGSLPATAASGGLSVSTTHAQTLIWGAARCSSEAGAAPSGFTLIPAEGAYTMAYYQTYTSAQTGLSLPDPPSCANSGIVGDAAQQ